MAGLQERSDEIAIAAALGGNRVKPFGFSFAGFCPEKNPFVRYNFIICGEMAERSIAAVLKTVEAQTSGGSNPSLSAKMRGALEVPLSFWLRE